ncbi:MAG: porphobilinogen synthase [Desulfohalobiaceae bacterium]|nr:porphobilinogen synthase [Desulfohalobiaceae bacterium]
MPDKEPFFRGRRLRSTPGLRDMVRETRIGPQDLVQPYFVVENDPQARQEISSMPGQYQLGREALLRELEHPVGQGLRAIVLFGVPEHKDENASGASDPRGVIQDVARRVKEAYPELTLITDVCLCEYTSHGHCGLVQNGHVLNDATLERLADTALSQVQAGADVVAPSDMMDGRIAAIRRRLDSHGYVHTPILSYAVKYASAFYGPFREAAQSAPEFGDRRTYQMDPGNRREALREAEADIEEGADMLMVKPAQPYLDVLRTIRERFDYPLAAYQVSGEYSMLKAAERMGWLDGTQVALEALNGIKRAGADLILSYFTAELLPLL